MARCNSSAPISPVGPAAVFSSDASFHRQAGAKACPGAAAIPWSRVRSELFAEVTIDEIGQRGDRGIRLRAVGAHRDRRSLADAQRQNIEDALGVSNLAVLLDLDARVFEASGRLHEKRGRPSMKPDLVHYGQTAFGYDSTASLSGVVCSPDRIRSRSLEGSLIQTPPSALKIEALQGGGDGHSDDRHAGPPPPRRWIAQPPPRSLRQGPGGGRHPSGRGTATGARLAGSRGLLLARTGVSPGSTRVGGGGARA